MSQLPPLPSLPESTLFFGEEVVRCCGCFSVGEGTDGCFGEGEGMDGCFGEGEGGCALLGACCCHEEGIRSCGRMAAMLREQGAVVEFSFAPWGSV